MKRVLDEAEISWGYFTDHNPFEPHCNAHPNNLVVLDPTKNEHSNILAALDFDLAYDSESFINTIEPDPMMFTDAENREIQEKLYGTRDLSQFDDWINSEKYELETALGGLENFQFEFAGMEAIKDCGMIVDLICLTMNDICVKKYRESYNRLGWLWDDLDYQKDKDLQDQYKQHLSDIQNLINVSICLTQDQRT